MTHTTRFIVIVCLAALVTLVLVSCKKETTSCKHVTQWFYEYDTNRNLKNHGLSKDFGICCGNYLAQFKDGEQVYCPGNNGYSILKTVIE